MPDRGVWETGVGMSEIRGIELRAPEERSNGLSTAAPSSNKNLKSKLAYLLIHLLSIMVVENRPNSFLDPKNKWSLKAYF